MVSMQDYFETKTRDDLPKFKAGDRVKVHVRVVEGDKERLQPFEGDVISIRGSRDGKSFTVRKISSGVGVERIFPMNSPQIAKIELLREGVVRRAKLYYLRGLSGKAAKIKSKELARQTAGKSKKAGAKKAGAKKTAAKKTAAKKTGAKKSASKK
ncbi:MAG: 50S ribosomal protein L19 [Ignavibacteriales bacterium]|nr:50S ribosomal protein L19 [Ignavibacteriales bacterium]